MDRAGTILDALALVGVAAGLVGLVLPYAHEPLAAPVLVGAAAPVLVGAAVLSVGVAIASLSGWGRRRRSRWGAATLVLFGVLVGSWGLMPWLWGGLAP